jgi:antitoxin (DNA-binding transcriptional repressor) of toxin-antitoxin stability system
LGTLPRGCSVLRIGEREPLRLVDHLRAGTEVAMTDTDAAMLGLVPARAGRPGDEPAAAVPAALDSPPLDEPDPPALAEPDIPEQPRGG